MKSIRILAILHLITFTCFWLLMWVGTRLTPGEVAVIGVPGLTLAAILTFADFLWALFGDDKD